MLTSLLLIKIYSVPFKELVIERGYLQLLTPKLNNISTVPQSSTIPFSPAFECDANLSAHPFIHFACVLRATLAGTSDVFVWDSVAAAAAAAAPSNHISLASSTG